MRNADLKPLEQIPYYSLEELHSAFGGMVSGPECILGSVIGADGVNDGESPTHRVERRLRASAVGRLS